MNVLYIMGEGVGPACSGLSTGGILNCLQSYHTEIFQDRVRVWGEQGEAREHVMDDLLSSFLSSASETQANSWLTL